MRNQATLGISLNNLADLGKAYAPMPGGEPIAKRVKFNWADAGPKPRLCWLQKDKLQVDHVNYQRAYSHGRSVAMARRFCWQRFETITVAERPDGSFWVIEGQHRLAAAMLRDDIAIVPCSVYNVSDLREEASAFVAIGTGSKPLTSVDKHQPSVTMGNPAAVLVQQVLDEAGYHISGNTTAPKAAKCVGALQKLAADADSFKRIWPLLVSVHHGEALHTRVVEGIAYLYKHSSGQIAKDPYRKRLIARGRAGLIADANWAASFYASGGSKVWASGIASVMSKGLREDSKILVSLDASPKKGA